ncbi:thioredoxin fold domain-containing protein [Fulvimarina sp. MAC3]|uniref:thioredoxin fold domain-containing protein n=1 Tax=Fulvimarina sp. MAC3 TaxID=3148887 RepID=UPI0031FCD21F
MFRCIVNAPRKAAVIKLALLLCLAGLAPAQGLAAELLMLEQPGCPWCKRFNEEIAPGYANSAEGEIAPLRRVDITEDWPKDLAHIRKERLTPTFVLMDNGEEIDRLRGYPGDNFFYSMLGEMLAKLPDENGVSGVSDEEAER